LPAVTNIGIKPTFGSNLTGAESHILANNVGDLYGQKIKIELLKFVRIEQKFENASALISQVQKDIETAKLFFKEGKL